MKKYILAVLLVSLLPTAAFAEEAHKITGGVAANYTVDTRDMNRLTPEIFLNLPYRFSYFMFMNLESPLNGNNFDLDSFYGEHDLWWNPYAPVPLDAVIQWQLGSGATNDKARFGMRWRVWNTPGLQDFFEKIHFILNAQVHALQTDFDNSPGWGISFEYFWKWLVLPQLLQERVYLFGFVDHNLDYGGATAGNNHAFVAEAQLGVRMIGGLHAVSEVRYSDYVAEKWGVGFGLEYKFSF